MQDKIDPVKIRSRLLKAIYKFNCEIGDIEEQYPISSILSVFGVTVDDGGLSVKVYPGQEMLGMDFFGSSGEAEDKDEQG